MVNSGKSQIGKYAVMVAAKDKEAEIWLTSAYSAEDAAFQCSLEASAFMEGAKALRVVPFAGDEPTHEDFLLTGRY